MFLKIVALPGLGLWLPIRMNMKNRQFTFEVWETLFLWLVPSLFEQLGSGACVICLSVCEHDTTLVHMAVKEKGPVI